MPYSVRQELYNLSYLQSAIFFYFGCGISVSCGAVKVNNNNA